MGRVGDRCRCGSDPPPALGSRRLQVHGWIVSYLLGLLVATPAALIVVVPNL